MGVATRATFVRVAPRLTTNEQRYTMPTILGVEVDSLPFLDETIVEAPVTINGYRAALISAIARGDRVVLARPSAAVVAGEVVIVPVDCRPFVLEHLGKKHGEHVPRYRLRPGSIHVRLTTGQVLTEVPDMAARLQAVHNLMSRHDVMLDLEEAQRVTHMTGKGRYHAGDEDFRPRQTPLRGNGAPPP